MTAKPLTWVRYAGGALAAVTNLRADYWITKPLDCSPRHPGKWVAQGQIPETVCDTEAQAMDACQFHFEAEVAAMLREQ